MIVYVGNMLSRHGSSINFMELLIPRLRDRYSVKAASSIKNKFIRLLSILYCIFSNRKHCKLVLIDTYSTQAFVYAYLSATLCRILALPYTPILHGGNLPERYTTKPRSLTKFLAGATNIVSPSLYLQHYFSTKGFKIEYIPNFLDLDNYTFLGRHKIKPNLLWVRAFQKIYNPALAIEAFRIVLESYPGGRLCMVGAIKDQTIDQVRKLVSRYGISDKVKITGILPKKEWLRLSSEYDIFINTTTVDNMPISVIEAMALGLPVVSTNVGGMPYLIQHNVDGLLVPSRNPEAMAEAVLDLLENPDKVKDQTNNARAKIESFSWTKIQGQWKQLIDHAEI